MKKGILFTFTFQRLARSLSIYSRLFIIIIKFLFITDKIDAFATVLSVQKWR